MKERPTVPRAQFGSAEGKPILKEPVWTFEIPLYFYAGGLAGASAALAFASELRGNDVLARRAWSGAAVGAVASPALLISDLGRPSRFLNMLRMFKVTSPMSVGSWILAAFGGVTSLAVTSSWFGWWGRLGPVARLGSAMLGLPLSSYTAALVAQTSTPVWHEARTVLPFVFTGGAAASAGAWSVALTATGDAGAARRLAVGGAVCELVSVQVMERSLGDAGAPYHEGPAGILGRAGKTCTAAGAGLIAWRGARSRRAAVAGALALTAGAMLERWSVFRAGFQSAARPQDTVGPQRARAAASGGASRRAASSAADGSPAVHAAEPTGAVPES